MQIVEPAVTSHAVAGALLGAVVAQLANGAIDLGIVGDDCAAVAERAEIFLDDETDSRGVAEFSDAEPIAAGTDGLGIVLNDLEVVLVGNLADRFHVGALTIKMNWNEQLRARCNRCFNFARINAIGAWIGIDEYGGRAGNPDRFGGGEESVGRGDALVSRADAERLEGEPQGVGSVANPNRVSGPMKGGEFLLEAFQHRAHDVLAALQHFVDIGIDFRLDVVILAYVPVEGDVELGLKHFDLLAWMPGRRASRVGR